MPANIPTMQRRITKMITAIQAGTPSHMVVLSLNRASMVTAREKQRIAREIKQRTKKRYSGKCLNYVIVPWTSFLPKRLPTSVPNKRHVKAQRTRWSRQHRGKQSKVVICVVQHTKTRIDLR